MALQPDGAIWPLIVQRARTQPSLPYLTSIDHEGMRTELSGTSLLNAVAKTAGALVTEADLEPGARIAMHLPWHWQRVAWTLAAWTVGAVVVEQGDAQQCDLLVPPASGDGPALELRDGSAMTRVRALEWVVENDGTDSRLLLNRNQTDDLAPWLMPALHPLVGSGAVILCDGQDSAVTAQREGATRIWS